LLPIIREGYLADIRVFQVRLATDLQGVHTSGGDFVEGELGAALLDANAPEHAADAYLEQADGRGRRGDGRRVHRRRRAAEAVSGGTPLDERCAIIARLREGETRVGHRSVLTEGFDEPLVDCIVIARPTKSRPLYVQMAGRGAGCTRASRSSSSWTWLRRPAATSSCPRRACSGCRLGRSPSGRSYRRSNGASARKRSERSRALIARGGRAAAAGMGAGRLRVRHFTRLGRHARLLPAPNGSWAVVRQVDAERRLVARPWTSDTRRVSRRISRASLALSTWWIRGLPGDRNRRRTNSLYWLRVHVIQLRRGLTKGEASELIVQANEGAARATTGTSPTTKICATCARRRATHRRPRLHTIGVFTEDPDEAGYDALYYTVGLTRSSTTSRLDHFEAVTHVS
jgi:hypothetical protein